MAFNGPEGHAEFTMSAEIQRCVAVVSWHHHGTYDADSMNYSRVGAFSFSAVAESDDPDPDAGPDTGPDTGGEPSSPGGGCSCSSHPAPLPRVPLVVLALLLGFWFRRVASSRGIRS
ncbi:MAG: hypothetical protein CVU65_18865 [Deltaproteobacteria bacterium HGW-Deltaproteobacteria-22]|nr:MAG: hypothetical protein CVU65_18865 [Deltaproteobacteria bacterium HGW-Deltaproteobacteria-22]